jgi:tetratricopeptide (TPR) repeat protein
MPHSALGGSLIALCLLLAACSTPEKAPPDPEASYPAAFRLLWEDKPQQAADMAEAVLADLPPPQSYDEVTQYGDTLLLLCEAQTVLKQYSDAEKSCLKAIDTFETEHGSYQRHAPLDAYDQAFAVYESVGFRPHWIAAELALRQRYLERLPVQAMLIAPRIDTLTRVGDLHRASGNWPQAEAAYREAIGFTDRLHQHHYSDADRKPCRHLADLLLERGDASAAAEALGLCAET